MSKITQALEKAARERLMRERQGGEDAVVTAPTAAVPTIVVPSTVPVPVQEVDAKVDQHLVPFFDRQNPICEQYRMLRTNLQSLRLSQGFKTLLVTSSMHNEGKTVSAINLALTLAQQPNCNVLLIDADLRKGSVKRWLGLAQRPGLSEVLSEDVKPSDAFVKLHSSSLTILPSGKVMTEPSEWLDSLTMREYLQQFKKQFDYVIVDTPPVLLVADACVLSRYVDGVLLVVRSGRTQRRQLTDAQARLAQVKARIIGSVLTHVEYFPFGYNRYYREYQSQAAKEPRANGKTVSS